MTREKRCTHSPAHTIHDVCHFLKSAQFYACCPLLILILLGLTFPENYETACVEVNMAAVHSVPSCTACQREALTASLSLTHHPDAGMAVSLTYEAWDKPLLLSNDFSLKVLNGSIMVMLLIWALLVPLFFRYTLDRRTACIALILYLVALTCIIVAG